MNFLRTDNPIADYDSYCEDQERNIEKLPVCECCGKRILTEKAFYYNDQWACQNCSKDFWESIKEDFEVEVKEIYE